MTRRHSDSSIHDGRLRSPAGADRKRTYYAARERARRRIAAMYPKLFARLVAEELEAVGYVPGPKGVRIDI